MGGGEGEILKSEYQVWETEMLNLLPLPRLAVYSLVLLCQLYYLYFCLLLVR